MLHGDVIHSADVTFAVDRRHVVQARLLSNVFTSYVILSTDDVTFAYVDVVSVTAARAHRSLIIAVAASPTEPCNLVTLTLTLRHSVVGMMSLSSGSGA
jgi:hypothetical protein